MCGQKEVNAKNNHEDNNAGRQEVSRPKGLSKEKANRTVMADIWKFNGKHYPARRPIQPTKDAQWHL